MVAEAFEIATAAIRLAATVFQTAKGTRDITHTAMSEKQDILDLLQENQEEMDLRAELCNEHEECLDQTKLTQDLGRLRVKIDGYYKWPVEADAGGPRRMVLTLKAVYKAGGLKPKLEAWNRDISRIRTHQQERNVPLLKAVAHRPDTKSQMLDQFDNQNRMQTGTTLALVETIRAEATEVIKVEPDGFASQPTQVRCLLLTYHIIDLDCSDERQAARRRGMLISMIVLSDGVERVGKTGVAIELSDQGARTGIVYMIQLRNETSALGLFDSLLAGSDQTVAMARRQA